MIDTGLVVSGLTIFIFLLISAFFSAAETSLTAVSRARIFQLVRDGHRRAELVSRLRKHKESLIGTVLIGNNLVNAAASTVATALFIRLFGDDSQALVGVTLLMAVLIIIFAEILPKTYALQNSERVAMSVAPIIRFLVMMLTPVNACVQVFIRAVLKIAGLDDVQGNLLSATDIVRGTIELHHREGKMVKQDRDMLGSILDLNDIEVRDIMVHRTHVDMLCADLPPERLAEHAFTMLHSRMPLWKGSPDNIVGVLHAKDLIRTLNAARSSDAELTTEAIMALAHKPWFIPESTSLRDQLIAFRARRQHFAIVVDEYGAVLGIVTLEDIIEEIVGDIDDEHDELHSGGIQRAGEQVFYVAGSMTIRDVNRELDWNLPDENASTVAGLVIHEARVIPAKGQHFDFYGFRFTVIDKNATQIKRLKVERLSMPSASEEAEAH